MRAEGTQFIDYEDTGGGSWSIFIDDLANNTLLLNATLPTGIYLDAGGSCYNRSWYLDVNVSDGTSPLEDMNVTIFNKSDVEMTSELTDANGRIIRKNITEYTYCPTTYVYQSNYTVNTSDNAGGYNPDSTSVNMTTNKFLNIVLSPVAVADTTEPTIVWEDPTPADAETITNNYVYLNTTISDDSNTSAFLDWNNSLLGYWSFENVLANGSVYDNSSHKNHGIMYNFTFNTTVDGKYGNALNASNDNEWVKIFNGANLDGFEQMSLETWVKTDFYGWDVMIHKSSSYQLVQTVGGGARFDIYNSSGSVVPVSGGTISGGGWHHVVGTYNGSQMKLFVDGLLVSNNSLTGNVQDSASQLALLGSQFGGGAANATLDEIKLYNRALTPEEINASMNNGVWRLYNNFTNLNNAVHNYSAYAIDTAGNLNITSLRTVTVDAQVPPIVQSSRISPTAPNTSSTLLGYCNATDANGDNLIYYYEWYNETTLFSSGTAGPSCYSGHTDNGDGTCTVTLRPNAAGDNTSWTAAVPAVSHYLNVDEASADEDSTYIYTTGEFGGAPTFRISIKENSVVTNTVKSTTSSYQTGSVTKTTRPSDNGAWTIDDIDNLQIGGWVDAVPVNFDLFNLPASNIPTGSSIDSVVTYARYREVDKSGIVRIRMTQVYAEVTYTLASLNFTQGVEVNINNLSSTNTAKYQNWTFNCSAFDGTSNSSGWENYSVYIANSLPEQTSLSSPTNGGTVTDRTPSLQWSAASDADSDDLTYHVLVDNNIDFSSPIINLSPPGEGVSGVSHTPTSDLVLDTLYYWKVRAHDGDGFGIFSDVWNFTVASNVEITLPTSGISC